MAKIAFLGLGQMGAPMARRLLQAGHQLTVWNRTADRAKQLAAEGAVVAGSPAQAGVAAEFAITMLATPEALQEVVLSENGLAKGLGAGQVYIDMSTVGPDTVRLIADELPKGVAVVDAPVRGSVNVATEGRLEVFVGARDEDFERVRPILESLGSVRRVGGLGAGAAMKLVANLALGASITAVGEALALGEALSLDRGPILNMFEGSQLAPVVRTHPNFESGHYPPAFKLRHAAKDLRLVVEAAAAANRDVRVSAASRTWLDLAVERGAADLDLAAVVATIVGEEPQP
jgi:3-hydroxyisobutyrate dehydrogenase-like beta-hydroxyacid dehydrogenase